MTAKQKKTKPNIWQDKIPRSFVTSCCTKCGKPKNDKDFNKEKRNRDGLRSVCKECCKEWVNKDQQKEYRAKNKDIINERCKAWRKTSVKYNVSQNVRNRIRSFLQRMGGRKNNKTSQIIGCSYEELMVHLEKQFLKGMSWDNRTDWHIDHITPLASATTQEEMESLCHFTNLRPVWAKENLEKSKRIVFLI